MYVIFVWDSIAIAIIMGEAETSLTDMVGQTGKTDPFDAATASELEDRIAKITATVDAVAGSNTSKGVNAAARDSYSLCYRRIDPPLPRPVSAL